MHNTVDHGISYDKNKDCTSCTADRLKKTKVTLNINFDFNRTIKE